VRARHAEPLRGIRIDFDYYFGMDMELARSMERVHLEFMRTRVLEILDTEYPNSLHIVTWSF
jgi:hypothetical protein